VVDKNGNPQTLNLGTLAAGASNFPDSAQHSPPASAGIKWYIPPLATGETVDHYCIRARVTSSNDVNSHNNSVQSNIAYTAYTPAFTVREVFQVGNPFREKEIPIELRYRATLPEGWKVQIGRLEQGLVLKPGEARPLELGLKMPEGADKVLEPPLDGDVWGKMHGDFEAEFTGSMTDTILSGNKLLGQFAALLPEIGTITGPFEGTLNRETAEIEGRVRSPHPHQVGEQANVKIEGCLRPWRRVDISQWLGNHHIGGVTVQVQVPWTRGPCACKLPPTDTKVKVDRREGYVLVSGKDLMHRYTLVGELQAEWRLEGEVRSFAVGPDDSVYVAVAGIPAVFRYDADGQPTGDWALEVEAERLSVAPSGEVIVASGESRLVTVYSPDGDHLDTWETQLG
jgi:hypothetical protein